MATRGFEFAYMLDGSQGTPMIVDWPMAADTAGYKRGDALVCDSMGRADKAANGASAFFAICAEQDTTTVAADEELKVVIVTRGQVWRCSMDAASTAIKKVYDKTVDIVDENTVDADGSGSGALVLWDTGLDDESNVLAYVSFDSTDLHGST